MIMNIMTSFPIISWGTLIGCFIGDKFHFYVQQQHTCANTSITFFQCEIYNDCVIQYMPFRVEYQYKTIVSSNVLHPVFNIQRLCHLMYFIQCAIYNDSFIKCTSSSVQYTQIVSSNVLFPVPNIQRLCHLKYFIQCAISNNCVI